MVSLGAIIAVHKSRWLQAFPAECMPLEYPRHFSKEDIEMSGTWGGGGGFLVSIGNLFKKKKCQEHKKYSQVVFCLFVWAFFFKSLKKM